MKGFFGAFLIFIVWASVCIYYLHLKEDTSMLTTSTKVVLEEKTPIQNIQVERVVTSISDSITAATNLEKDLTITNDEENVIKEDSINSSSIDNSTISFDAKNLANEIKKTISINDTIDIDSNEPKIEDIKDVSVPAASVSSKVFYPKYVNSDLILDKKLVAYASELKTYLVENPDKKVTIIGHTDNVGNGQDNFKIGLKKARQIKWYLTARRNIPRRKITAISRGEEEPIESNKNTWGRAKNNRIEIIID